VFREVGFRVRFLPELRTIELAFFGGMTLEGLALAIGETERMAQLHEAQYLMHDQRRLLTPPVASLPWLKTEVLPKFATYGIEDHLILLPEDLVTSKSIQQSLQGMRASGFNYRIFSSYPQLELWLQERNGLVQDPMA